MEPVDLQPQPQPPTVSPPAPPQVNARYLLLGGLLPVAAFALVESLYGAKGGLIAGIAFGAGEILWEYRKLGKVQGITIGSNMLVIILGALSLYEDNSVFFKLQPAILLLVFALFLIVSSLMGKPFIAELAKKQNPNLPPAVFAQMRGLSLRVGFFFLFLTAISVHAAYYWSTAAWIVLKGVGTPAALVAYMAVEVVIIRWRIKRGP